MHTDLRERLLQVASNRLDRNAELLRDLGHRESTCEAHRDEIVSPTRLLERFFVSLVEREKTRQDAMVKGIPYSSRERCVRLPDVLTYIDMAQRLINFAQYNAQAMQLPAATLAQQTLERDFPCPAPTSR